MATRDVLPPRYADVMLIARGATGDVYRARDCELGRSVAVKLLAERFLADAQARGRFTREALAAARLSAHPHVVTIYDVGAFAGRPFIVMEYLAGGTLAERLRLGGVARAGALDWLAQSADALDAAHRQGIVHRDFKPANVLFDAEGRVRVADFGIARVLVDASAEPTLTGVVLGTPAYLAPEQARGGPATPASDLYALAVVAYELLTGSRPFKRDSEAAEAAAHIADPVPPPSQRGVGMGEAVDRAFARALAKDPVRRQVSARRFVDELAFALRRDAHPLPAARSGRADALRRRRVPLLALALAAILLAAGGGVAAAMLVASRGSPHRAGEARTIVRTRVVTSKGTTAVRTVTTAVPAGTSAAAATTASSTAFPATISSTSVVTTAVASGPHALNDRGYSLMQQGDYSEALPLLEQAVAGLRGTGPADPYEGYANYNLGYTLLELGRCGEALAPLQRAAALEQRAEVTAAIARARRCA